MKYFSIVVIMGIFVLLYVWQNVEMMKMRSDYKRLIRTEKELSAVNDKLKFELEKLRNFNNIETYANKNNLKRLGAEDFIVIRTDQGSIERNEN